MKPAAALLALAFLLGACAYLTDRTPDRTPWGGYARETGRIIGARP